ncbi:MAG: BamA/TamA family outer membrane protein [Calditrichaeota bacterium]|nr:BamA/TamA family outer membrane protein [Calditrichota bacterium]
MKIIISVLCFTVSLFAQDFNNKKITTILVVGNDDTHEDVIKREILLQPGDSYSDSLRVLSEKRVSNLFLFNHVEIIPIPDEHNLSLLVNVTERFYLYPFPAFTIEDRDWDKLTYGFGLAHLNFRGRNEKLIGKVLFGYRPGFQLEYYNPWIGEKNRYTSDIIIHKYSTLHKTLDLDEEHLAVNWVLGRYWSRHFSTYVGFSFDDVTVPKKWATDSTNAFSYSMISGNRQETFAGINFTIAYDNRDLIAYPAVGWYTRFSYIKNGFFEPKIDYSKYIFDVRRYQTFGKVTFAGRIYSSLTSGDLPLYRQVYFGFKERVRGHFSEVIGPSRQSLLTNFEMRFPILPIRHISLPSSFMPESSTQNLQFGLNGALFFDSGITWSEKDQPNQGILKKAFDINDFISGFGAGLHFRLPYIEVARLEMGFDEDFNSEFIFEVSTAL